MQKRRMRGDSLKSLFCNKGLDMDGDVGTSTMFLIPRPIPLKVVNTRWVMMEHASNPSTLEGGAGGSLSSRTARAT